MQSPIADQGSPQRWIMFILLAGLIAITCLFIFSRVLQHTGSELIKSPYSTDKRTIDINLSGTLLQVPQNIIRKPEHRQQNPLKKLDLILLWPELEGYSTHNQVLFSDTSTDSRLIFVSLSKQDQPISSSERLYSIYSQYFAGDPKQGPHGLIGFAMDPASGFAGETIYFKPDENQTFVTRCVPSPKKTPTFCMREVVAPGNIQLTYRFREKLLNDWRQLDQAVLAYVNGLYVRQ